MTAKSVMVLGTTSGAGKSWLTTALCRYYARQGLKVAPYKAQNMSNNARVVACGEIGSAQYFQALAACRTPDVRMNPLLLKPEKDTQSQVVLMGQVNAELSRMEWRGRSLLVWPVVAQALDELLAENDVVVIEGAGSPAEINLKSCDIVNMRVALHANAACLLALGPQMLEDLTGVPTVATLPMWWQHGLPEEDGVFDDRSMAAGKVTKTVAVIAYPRISNLDEFQPLKNVPGVRLKWVRSPTELAGMGPGDWIILPGSKATSADLAWLRVQGLDQAITAHAGRGGAVLGICGGLQMLGEALIDSHGIDGNGPCLGLLPVVTVFDEAKTVQHRRAAFGAVRGLWAGLSGAEVQGYEIHHGQTTPHSAMAAAGDIAYPVMPEGLAWQNGAGNVMGLYLHRMFEDPRVLHALFGAATPTLDSVFDGLADYIGQHFEPGVLQSLIA
jgi:adenosylcobyric acid synthase